MLENSMCTLLERECSRHFSTSKISKSTQKEIAIEKTAGHTKSIVATSLAVVKCGLPALGFSSFAIISRPSSMVSRNTLLCWPS